MDGYRLLGCAGFALAMTLGPYAQAAECPREDALGTSRIIAVDGAATRLADARSLRLGDREVVLTFDADVIAGDWIPMTQQAQLKLLTDRLEAAGKGIILLHDPQLQMAAVLPDFLRYLRDNGYSVVHVVPREAARPVADMDKAKNINNSNN